MSGRKKEVYKSSHWDVYFVLRDRLMDLQRSRSHTEADVGIDKFRHMLLAFISRKRFLEEKKKRRYSGINFESSKLDMSCLGDWSRIELNNSVHSRCTDIFTSYGFSDIASLRMSKGHVESQYGS